MTKAIETMDVETGVTWALRDQGLGWVGREREQLDYSDYGTVIDDAGGGSHPNIGLLTDEDAEAVKAAIDGLWPEARVLVTQYGRTGLRPSWAEEGYGQYQQMIDGRGRLLWDYENPNNKRGPRRPRQHFVGLTRELVDWERGQYLTWWRGLEALVAPCNRAMSGHVFTPPAVAREPWNEPVARILGEAEFARHVRQPVLRRELDAEEIRRRAQDPVRAQASDWGLPERGVPMAESTASGAE